MGLDALTASLADRYRIERELGEGGMATVYLAQDLKHDRKVALKVLKPELAAVLGAERFVVEIKTTAALQHPHILPLFDSGTADSFLFYVMPFIDGETVRGKLDREGQFSVDEAVQIAKDVAEALDYAHQHGVIHRDIKPENILLANGRPMVADFGIALAVSAAAGGRMTETGLSLGTPHYMSPEQATAEKEITARSDVYSLGSVLYEMLTGEPPHLGNSAQAIIMKIVTEDAQPVTRLRKAVPPNVAAAVAKAVERLPADRFATAKAFAEALANPGFATVQATATHRASSGGRSRGLVWGLAAALVAVTLVAAWALTRPEPPAVVTAATLALNIRTPSDVPLNEVNRPISLAPDGSFLVYVGPDPDSAGATALWRRDLDRLEATPIPGTRGAQGPRVAYDGQTVSFSKRAASGNANVRWEVGFDGGLPRRASGASQQVSADHKARLGTLRPTLVELSAPDLPDSLLARSAVARQQFFSMELSHDMQWFAWTGRLSQGDSIVILAVGDSTPHAVAAGSNPVFLGGDLLAFVAPDRSVQVGRLSADRTRFVEPPQPVIPSVASAGSGAAVFSLGRDGTLIYAPGSSAGRSRPVWVGGNRVEPIRNAEWGIHGGVALSPNGTRVALVLGDLTAGADIWVNDLRLGTTSPLVRDGNSSRPVWLRNGATIAYMVRGQRAGTTDTVTSVYLATQAVDRSAPPTIFPTALPTNFFGEVAASPDDQYLAIRVTQPGTGRNIFYRRMANDSLVPFVTEDAQERGPRFSPDGRWLLYVSDRTGRDEVYAESFPEGGNRVQLSLEGGREGTWSRDGSQVLYRDLSGWMTAVRLTRGTVIEPVSRERLFDANGYLSNQFLTMYDVAPDGRFLMLQLEPEPERTELVIIRNWVQQVQARLGVGKQ